MLLLSTSDLNITRCVTLHLVAAYIIMYSNYVYYIQAQFISMECFAWRAPLVGAHIVTDNKLQDLAKHKNVGRFVKC